MNHLSGGPDLSGLPPGSVPFKENLERTTSPETWRVQLSQQNTLTFNHGAAATCRQLIHSSSNPHLHLHLAFVFLSNFIELHYKQHEIHLYSNLQFNDSLAHSPSCVIIMMNQFHNIFIPPIRCLCYL